MVIVAYLISTFGVMTAVPIKDQGSPAAIIEAVQVGFQAAGPFLGALVNIIFIGFFLFNTAVYTYSFGCLLFVSGLDRRLLVFMSKVNANRVPCAAVMVQSIISAFFAALTFIIVPYVIKTGFTPGNLSTDIYWMLQAAVTVIWCVSMVILFIDVIIIPSKYRDTFARIQLAPDWEFYLCSALGLQCGFVAFDHKERIRVFAAKELPELAMRVQGITSKVQTRPPIGKGGSSFLPSGISLVFSPTASSAQTS